MTAARELSVADLRRRCQSDELGFASTAEVEPLQNAVGQRRAIEAIDFGLRAEMPGYNIFAAGPVGTGKRTALEAQLHAHAAERPAPADWVYLHNFREPLRPIAVKLATGTARRLAADMAQFLDDARRELAAAFESENYGTRRRAVTEPIEHEQEAAMGELRREAVEQGVGLESTPAGIATVPLQDGHPLSPTEFAQLPDGVRESYQQRLEQLSPSIESFLNRMRTLQRQARDRLRDLERDVAMFAVGHLLDELRQRHGESEQLLEWFDAVAEDVSDNLSLFGPRRGEGEGEAADPLAALTGARTQALARYEVNAFITHDHDGGAPVVIETNPTFPNLFGRIEHQGVLGGGFVTDHRMLRPGAIHRANGGYLLLPAAEVLGQPLLWLKLKEALRARCIRLENPAEEFALIPTRTLTPSQIDLDVKVVMVGSARLYQLAYTLDEDVRKLFRVKAEFDWCVPWDHAAEQGYAAFVSAQVRDSGLRHFDAEAVARLIEHGSRLADDQDRLSTRFVEIGGLAAEAGHWAGLAGRELVGVEHVEQAIAHKLTRSNLLEEKLQEMISEGALIVTVDGECVGQVNGLSLLDLGDYAFGHPVRITATAGPGRGAVLSIDRETELSGPIHDKGFLTLSGFVRERYGSERRIAAAATLTFEQSYQGIEGDSAASAELYALLSRIADLPLRQDIAVTGSINQHGEIQAIGGVNEKIEGFHRTCALRGLTGHQGVLIPEANVRNLMLCRELLDDVAAGRFHVWSAADVDAGLALLTGQTAGQRQADGHFEPGSVHHRVEARLERWAEIAEKEAASAAKGEQDQ